MPTADEMTINLLLWTVTPINPSDVREPPTVRRSHAPFRFGRYFRKTYKHTLFVLSRLSCDLNQTYDVYEFKWYFLESRKTQFVVKLMKCKTLKISNYRERKSRHFRYAPLDVN